MSLPPEVTARIQAIEAKLAELDPILHGFCARRGYIFSSQVGVWPPRMGWAREEICLFGPRISARAADQSQTSRYSTGIFFAEPSSDS